MNRTPEFGYCKPWPLITAASPITPAATSSAIATAFTAARFATRPGMIVIAVVAEVGACEAATWAITPRGAPTPAGHDDQADHRCGDPQYCCRQRIHDRFNISLCFQLLV